MRCKNCYGEDFVEEDGLYYCAECLTLQEGNRVQVYEEKFEEGDGPNLQWQASSQVRAGPGEENSVNEKILTSWETFNICLKGLLNQMIQLGASPKLEALVFTLWTNYLKQTEAAFFSVDKIPPKLPLGAWRSDAVLVLDPQKTKVSVEDVVKIKKKGRLSKIPENNVEKTADDPGEDMPPPEKMSKREKYRIKRKFFDRTFADTASETVLQGTSDVMGLSYVPENDPSESHDRVLSKVFKRTIVPLRRRHLLAFIYLGVLLGREEIYLSDILRWIDEGHLHYNQLEKFFRPGVAVMEDLKEYFFGRKVSPAYSPISTLTRDLAVFLGIRSVPHPDLNRLVHKYCNEFNLPNQVALVSRRLVNLLPTRAQDPNLLVTMTSYETRAMAQIIVTLKILLGLDDATEHRNSKIAVFIKEALKKGGSTIEPFVWAEWVRWNSLRSLALLLYGHTSATPQKDSGLYQNVDSLISCWGEHVSSSKRARAAVTRKMETEFMSELIERLSRRNLPSSEEKSPLPPTTTPLASYTEAVINDLARNLLPCSEDSWNSIVRNIDFSELTRDFRCKSIEYLLHPERYIKWAQERGLHIGLRNGGAFKKALQPPKTRINKEAYLKGQTTMWRVSLTKKSKKTSEKVQSPGTKAVVVPAATRPDKTDGRPLEPLLDLTEHVPERRFGSNHQPVPQPTSMPALEDEDKYLHLPSTEYHTHSGKAREAPISFRHLAEQAARYLYVRKSDLLAEINYLENIHKNFLDFCSGEIDKDSPEIIALKG